jgi:hypothetical protein
MVSIQVTMQEPLEQIDPHCYRLTRLIIARAEIERLRRASATNEHSHRHEPEHYKRDDPTHKLCAPEPTHERLHILRLTVPGWSGAAREQFHDRVR